jgi:hypothetical protein
MKRRIGNLLLVFLVLTVALATVSVGYGLWFGQINIQGQVDTGSVSLAFADIAGTPHVTPYTNDDHVVNDPTKDPNDVGVCNMPVIDDDGDGVEGEDPVNNNDDDGDGLVDEDPAGKLSTCDPRSQSLWSVLPIDEDGDGLVDEDAADGVDNDTDGLLDEDGLGGWVLPFAAATPGQDIGKTTVYVNSGGKLLQVSMANPSVSGSGIVYSPTVFAHVVNEGTIPVVVVDIAMTLTPAYELWDRNQDGVLTDSPVLGVCDLNLGDECAAPLVAKLTGINVGDILDPGDQVPIELKVSMTPAAVPGNAYSLALAITGNNFNEPGA